MWLLEIHYVQYGRVSNESEFDTRPRDANLARARFSQIWLDLQLFKVSRYLIPNPPVSS